MAHFLSTYCIALESLLEGRHLELSGHSRTSSWHHICWRERIVICQTCACTALAGFAIWESYCLNYGFITRSNTTFFFHSILNTMKPNFSQHIYQKKRSEKYSSPKMKLKRNLNITHLSSRQTCNQLFIKYKLILWPKDFNPYLLVYSFFVKRKEILCCHGFNVYKTPKCTCGSTSA